MNLDNIKNIERNYGLKWGTYFLKIRPIINIVSTIVAIFSTGGAGFVVILGAFLQGWLLYEAFQEIEYSKIFTTIKINLIYELVKNIFVAIVYVVFTIIVNNYLIASGVDLVSMSSYDPYVNLVIVMISPAFTIGYVLSLLIISIVFFVLNMKYFKKRLI